jgi:hypothetical protein
MASFKENLRDLLVLLRFVAAYLVTVAPAVGFTAAAMSHLFGLVPAMLALPLCAWSFTCAFGYAYGALGRLRAAGALSPSAGIRARLLARRAGAADLRG